MERGLFWLPLLALFIGLAWSGWNEYQKVEAYRIWAEQFDRAKYDLYAVLGQKGSEVTWGKPTRKGPIDLQTFSLVEVVSANLIVNDQAIDLTNPPNRGRTIAVEFRFADDQPPVRIPFTEISLATRWAQYFQQALKNLKPDSVA